MEFRPENPERFETALRRFNEETARDPNVEIINGGPQPRELVYAQWLTDWVLRLCPEASEQLRLAARSQHLCRWAIPRESYPMTRAGYLQWREALKRFHALRAGEILREVGYAGEIISHVQNLIQKKNFPRDAEGRVIEDALCLVFLERQFPALARKTAKDKMINALQKAWRKMTPAAQAIARELPYADSEKALLEEALM